uniref:Uncharacterized protein n=1 Tax=Clastoptera arizonana TaxID=38151 RepID=A0A1B6C8R9_9HEMI
MSSDEKQKNIYSPNPKSYRIDLSLLLFALSILVLKAVIGNWSEIITWCCNGSTIWSILFLPLQWILSVILSRAVFIGCLISLFSCQIVYLDSNKPGIDPPSPLSPVKYRKQSGSNWHLNYLVPFLMGPLIAILLSLGIV